MPSFSLESSFNLPGPGGKNTLVYIHRHEPSGLRVVLAPLPTPLVHTSIVVPTHAADSKGHPHTLEHLIFCGSASHPTRGYLDTLAQRTLADGTNAYTAADHTAYTVDNVGTEGASYLLPVFLDHVIRPTLIPEAFTTEVYHVDGTGRKQGVVYSEISSVERDEDEVGERAIRQLLFSPSSTYAHDSGGLSWELSKLSNEECIAYHASYYSPSQVTVIVVGGSLTPEEILSPLTNLPCLASPPRDKDENSKVILNANYRETEEGQEGEDAVWRIRRETFPSTCPDVGSMIFGR